MTSLWLLAPALVIGLALRLFNLGGRNTWYDEIGSILFAEKGLGTIVQATVADTMPPLYYFLLHYWLVAGNDLWVARSLSVVLGLGMVVLAFAIARRLFGPRVALFAALLVSVNPFQVYHGQETRMYSLLGFTQLLSIYFFLRCCLGNEARVYPHPNPLAPRGHPRRERGQDGWRNWVGFVLSQAAAMYTHNAAFLVLLTVDAYAFGSGILFLFRQWRQRRRLAGADVGDVPPTLGRGVAAGFPSPGWATSPSGVGGKFPSGGWGRLQREPVTLLKELFLANVAVVAAFSPWLAFLPGQIAKVTRAFWTEPPGAIEIIRSIMVFTFNLPSPAPWALPVLLAISMLLLALLVYTVVLALRSGALGERNVLASSPGAPVSRSRGFSRKCPRNIAEPDRRGDRFSLTFAVCLFAGPIVIAFLVSLVRPIFIERVLITSSVVYLVLLAWMADCLRPRLIALVCFVPMILLSFWSLAAYYQYDQFPRVSFPQLVAYLEDSVAPEDIVIHDNKLTFFPAYYLDRNLPQRFIADPKWSINDTFAEQTQEALGLFPVSLPEATAGKQRVIFVIFAKALAEADEQGRRQENKAWLDDNLRLSGETRVGDLIVYTYEPK